MHKVRNSNTFSISWEDVLKQQEISNHIEDIHTALCTIKDFTFDALNLNSKIDFNSKQTPVKELRDLFESTFAKHIKYSYKN